MVQRPAFTEVWEQKFTCAKTVDEQIEISFGFASDILIEDPRTCLKVLTYLEGLLKEYPTSADQWFTLYYQRASALLYLKRHEDAGKCLNQLKEIPERDLKRFHKGYVIGLEGLILQVRAKPAEAEKLLLEGLSYFSDDQDKLMQFRLRISRILCQIDQGHLEEAQEILDPIMSEVEELGDPFAISQALNTQCHLLFHRGHYGKLILVAQRLLEVSEQTRSHFFFGAAHNYLGLSHFKLGRNDLALEQLLKALKHHEQFGAKAGNANLLNNIALVYKDTRSPEEARHYFRRAMRIALDYQAWRFLSMIYNNLGLVCLEEGECLLALFYFFQSLYLKEQTGTPMSRVITRSNIALSFRDKGHLERAIQYNEETMEYCHQVGYKAMLGDLMLMQSNFVRENGDPARALGIALQVLQDEESRGLEDFKRVKDCYDALYKAETDLGETRRKEGLAGEACEHYHQAITYRERLAEIRRKEEKENLNNRLMEMKARFDTERAEKEREIYRLRNIELTEANRKLQEAQDNLLKLERQNTAMAMAVTANHEINQPLMILRGSLEMIESGLAHPSHAMQKHLKRSLGAVDRIATILSRFRSISDVRFETYTQEEPMVITDDSQSDNHDEK